MYWENNWYLRFICLVVSGVIGARLVSADQCPVPEIANGRILIDGTKEEGFLFGEVLCDQGYHLVGFSKTLKCREGVWSQRVMPMCAGDRCPELPHLHNGRNIKVAASEGSAYHFKCNKGYKRYGMRNTHCDGQSWSHGDNTPVCTKNTCDQTGMLDIPYGQGKSLMRGAVYKYRCNKGTEMEGRDTLACTGLHWNGSLPSCNVAPSPPKMEFLVSGQPVEEVKAGDWVLVSCQARGGNPVPDIGLMLDNKPHTSKDFRQFKNTFTFLASEDMDNKNIQCTASNKMGQSKVERILTVLSPPTSLKLQGPDTVQLGNSYTFTCSVTGGVPAPAIKWTVGGEEREAEVNDEGQSVLTLDTEKEEVTETVISCKAENSEGVVSESLSVNTEYLPKSIKINSPSSMKEAEEATVSCLLSNSFPVPEITWTVEKIGDKDDLIEKRADVSGAVTEDKSLLVTEILSLETEASITEVKVSCAAHVEGLGSVSSETVTIEVEEMEIIDYTTTEIIMEEEEEESESQKKDTDLFENFSVEPSLVEGNSDEEFEEESAQNISGEEKEYVKLITEDDDYTSNEADATEQRDKILWIPYNSEEDIEDYQNNFSPKFAFNADATESEEEFLQASSELEPRQGAQKGETSVLVSNPTPMILSPASLSGSGAGSLVPHLVTIVSSYVLFLLMKIN